MALAQIMEEAAFLAAQGKDAQCIAERLKVSLFWVNMLMGTDGFKLAVENYRGKGEDAQG